MLILSKSLIGLILGLIISILLGAFVIPFFKKKKIGQSVSHHLNVRHLAKSGTPTMGGIIFVLPPLIILTLLFFTHRINFSLNLVSIIFVFLAYAVLGFLDDFLKVKWKNNKGLSILGKLFCEVIIALLFFIFFLLAGNNTILSLFNMDLDLKYLYGIFMLFMLVASSNAVNITDGLDGLCAGLCAISYLTYGIIAWNSSYVLGYQEIALFCFILAGSLMGFLFFNFYPAKIFMGDLGALALGGTLAAIAIILKKEMSLILIGIVYIIETLSSLFQIIAIKCFKKKILLKSPLHHHLEELNYCESDIIKIFYVIGLLFSLISLIIYVWL